MKLAILLLAFVALSAFAAEPKPETKMQKDQRECKAEGDAAVKSAKMQHPGEATKIQQTAFNKCMRGKSYAMPPIREK